MGENAFAENAVTEIIVAKDGGQIAVVDIGIAENAGYNFRYIRCAFIQS